MSYNTSALLGAVIFSWFPEDEDPSSPGPKFRPTLIVEIDHKKRRLRLAKGTSQHTTHLGRGEFTVEKDNLDGLEKDTKFCLMNTKWVPLTTEFLSITKRSINFRVVGHLNLDCQKRLLRAISEVEF